MKRTPIERRTRIKPVNRKRRARLFAEDFGSREYVEHLHQYPCAICDVYGWSVAAHTKSRGAGGKVDDLVPLCASRFLGTANAVEGCHERLDRHDESVEEHRMRLRSMAKKLWAEFQDRGEE